MDDIDTKLRSADLSIVKDACATLRNIGEDALPHMRNLTECMVNARKRWDTVAQKVAFNTLAALAHHDASELAAAAEASANQEAVASLWVVVLRSSRHWPKMSILKKLRETAVKTTAEVMVMPTWKTFYGPDAFYELPSAGRMALPYLDNYVTALMHMFFCRRYRHGQRIGSRGMKRRENSLEQFMQLAAQELRPKIESCLSGQHYFNLCGLPLLLTLDDEVKISKCIDHVFGLMRGDFLHNKGLKFKLCGILAKAFWNGESCEKLYAALLPHLRILCSFLTDGNHKLRRMAGRALTPIREFDRKQGRHLFKEWDYTMSFKVGMRVEVRYPKHPNRFCRFLNPNCIFRGQTGKRLCIECPKNTSRYKYRHFRRNHIYPAEELADFLLREKLEPRKESLDPVPFETFEKSPFKQVFDSTPYPKYDYEVTGSVHAFISLLPEVYGADADAKECETFCAEMYKECKERYVKELKGTIEAGANPLEALEPEVHAEVMWTSARRVKVFGGDRECCWLVVWCIRYGNVRLLKALMPFMKALNRFVAQPAADRLNPNPETPWDILSEWKLWRGGGFKMIHKDFFKVGKVFRFPAFWATSPRMQVTEFFTKRAIEDPKSKDEGIEAIRWQVNIDEEQKCFHVNYLKKSLIVDSSGKPKEIEFLFTQFSTFEVESVQWKTAGTATVENPHTITLFAFPDNTAVDSDLPLAPWN